MPNRSKRSQNQKSLIPKAVRAQNYGRIAGRHAQNESELRREFAKSVKHGTTAACKELLDSVYDVNAGPVPIMPSVTKSLAETRAAVGTVVAVTAPRRVLLYHNRKTIRVVCGSAGVGFLLIANALDGDTADSAWVTDNTTGGAFTTSVISGTTATAGVTATSLVLNAPVTALAGVRGAYVQKRTVELIVNSSAITARAGRVYCSSNHNTMNGDSGSSLEAEISTTTYRADLLEDEDNPILFYHNREAWIKDDAVAATTNGNAAVNGGFQAFFFEGFASGDILVLQVTSNILYFGSGVATSDDVLQSQECYENLHTGMAASLGHKVSYTVRAKGRVVAVARKRAATRTLETTPSFVLHGVWDSIKEAGKFGFQEIMKHIF
jgi:hypothetical protein